MTVNSGLDYTSLGSLSYTTATFQPQLETCLMCEQLLEPAWLICLQYPMVYGQTESREMIRVCFTCVHKMLLTLKQCLPIMAQLKAATEQVAAASVT